jgi:rhodanese-related sulfurtransferase
VNIETVLQVVAALAVMLLLSRMFLGKVEPTKARELVAAGGTLVDVRSPQEYSSGHIPGALNIPVQQLADRMRELGETSRPVVVYCASGMRSASARSMLRRAGFQHVHDLGAMRRWPV